MTIMAFFSERKWRFYGLILAGLLVSLWFQAAPIFSQDSVVPRTKPLVVATEPTFPPFEMNDEATGELTGFDIDLMNAIGEAISVPIEFQGYPFDGIIPGLQAGSIDAAISGITITPERAESVAFSSPYFKAGLAIAVKESDNEITKTEELAGRKIAVQIGTTGAIEAEKIPNAQVSSFDSAALSLQELVNGNVEAVVNDLPVTLYAIEVAGLSGVKVAATVGTEEYYGIAMPKAVAEGSEGTQALINRGLFLIIQNGTYNQIYDKWFGAAPPFLPLVAPSLVEQAKTVGSAATPDAETTPSSFKSSNFFVVLFRNLFRGAIITVLLTLFAVLFGLIGGTLVASALISDIKPLQWIFRIYVEFFRGTPMLVQLFIIYFGLPALFQGIGVDWTLDRFPAAVIALSLNVAAYLAEIIRGGIQSIDSGQTEACQSLGMSPLQTMKEVVFPQAFRRILPPLGNEFITLIKDTSLTAVIGFSELFREGQLVVATSYRAFEVYIAVALVYLLLTSLSSVGFKWLEAYMDPVGRAQKRAASFRL